MTWLRDDAKLGRVRALMAEQELDALVVRAPDNVVYLTNFWGMKGYDAVVFPREGEPVLICLEASEADADRMAWTSDVRFYATGDRSRLDGYGDACLRRVWRAEHFSWWMTTMLHRDPDGDPFGVRLQQSQLRHLRTSTAAATALAENYVGVERA